VSAQEAPAAQSKWQPPPWHVFAHVDPESQLNVHPPPLHDPWQTAPDWQLSVHPPPAHGGEQVCPCVHVTVFPPWPFVVVTVHAVTQTKKNTDKADRSSLPSAM
jgi:hypothetical protein